MKRGAISKLGTAVGRANKAKEYYSNADYIRSVTQLELLFDR